MAQFPKINLACFSSDRDFALFASKFKEKGIQISCLVTEKPRPKGRKLVKSPNPAHRYALEHSIPVVAFEKFDEAYERQIKKYNAKLGFIFAYGKIIPASVIKLFEYGILNIHFSLLPEYRGATPIQQAILDDKKLSGYTVFKITETLDRGEILIQEKEPIATDDNFETYRAKLIAKALRTLPAIITRYASGEFPLKAMPQESESYAGKIKKEDGQITNQDTARLALNKIRAYSFWPKTFVILCNKRLIIHKAHLDQDNLALDEVQLEGKTKMNFEEFKRGHSLLLTKLPKFVKIS